MSAAHLIHTVDNAIFLSIVTEVCATTNAKAILMLKEGGVCGSTSEKRLLSASNRYLASGECSLAGALQPGMTAMNKIISNSKAVKAVIDTALPLPLIPCYLHVLSTTTCLFAWPWKQRLILVDT
jgi:hypothetical protein